MGTIISNTRLWTVTTTTIYFLQLYNADLAANNKILTRK